MMSDLHGLIHRWTCCGPIKEVTEQTVRCPKYSPTVCFLNLIRIVSSTAERASRTVDASTGRTYKCLVYMPALHLTAPFGVCKADRVFVFNQVWRSESTLYHCVALKGSSSNVPEQHVEPRKVRLMQLWC